MEVTKVVLVLEYIENPANLMYPVSAVEQGAESPVYMLKILTDGKWFSWENQPPQWGGLEMDRIQLPNAERKEKGLLVLERRTSCTSPDYKALTNLLSSGILAPSESVTRSD